MEMMMRIRDAGTISAHDPIYKVREPDPQEVYDRMRTLAALHTAGGELHIGRIVDALGDPLDASVTGRANAVLARLVGNGLVAVDPEVPTLHRLTTPNGRTLAASLAT
jgi:hypothetical protein